MTNYTLNLKKRVNKATFSMPLSAISAIIDNGEEVAKQQLYNMFKSMATNEITIHDKFWLEAIVNWVPDGGLKMTELAKWMKLAKRVANLDDSREGTFMLSDFQVDLIWKRLNDDKYIYRQPLMTSFVEFLSDFEEVTGKHFLDEDPTKE